MSCRTLPRRCAQGHAQTDLAGALVHGVGQHAVDPDRRNEQRHGGECRQQTVLSRGCAALFESHWSIVFTFARASPASRSWILWRIEGSSACAEPSVRASLRTTTSIRGHEPRCGMAVIKSRGLLVQGLIAHVANHSDNCVSNFRLGAGAQGFADGVGIAKEFLGCRLTDDHHQAERCGCRRR